MIMICNLVYARRRCAFYGFGILGFAQMYTRRESSYFAREWLHNGARAACLTVIYNATITTNHVVESPARPAANKHINFSHRAQIYRDVIYRSETEKNRGRVVVR